MRWMTSTICDFCGKDAAKIGKFFYDAKTKQGPWALMCEKDFKKHGTGIVRYGVGQKYDSKTRVAVAGYYGESIDINLRNAHLKDIVPDILLIAAQYTPKKLDYIARQVWYSSAELTKEIMQSIPLHKWTSFRKDVNQLLKRYSIKEEIFTEASGALGEAEIWYNPKIFEPYLKKIGLDFPKYPKQGDVTKDGKVVGFMSNFNGFMVYSKSLLKQLEKVSGKYKLGIWNPTQGLTVEEKEKKKKMKLTKSRLKEIIREEMQNLKEIAPLYEGSAVFDRFKKLYADEFRNLNKQEQSMAISNALKKQFKTYLGTDIDRKKFIIDTDGKAEHKKMKDFLFKLFGLDGNQYIIKSVK
jgi:hypothetical protein